jgi:hypothetical protein
MSLSKVIGTNTRSNIMVKQESITTTQNQTDIDEDEDEPEEDWKVEAEESDSDIDAGDMSDGDVERRIRARRI